MPATVLTIGLTAYTSAQRAGLNFLGIDSLKISVDEYWELEWTVVGCSSNPPFVSGQICSLSIDQGGGPALVFNGNISETPIGQGNLGNWTFSYHAFGMGRRADWVSIQDGFGNAVCEYNLAPDDINYDPSRAGQTVGAIVANVLQIGPTASNLFAQGVGGYSSLGPPAVLAAQTLVDLAFLTFVPNFPVRIEGENCWAAICQFVKSCYAQICPWVDQNGIFRFVNPFGSFPTVTVTVPGLGSPGDPVEWPEYTPTTDHCYTQYQIIGQDYDGAILSTLEGSLTPVNSSGDRSAWNLNYHLFPFGAAVYGTLSVTSSTTATVTCDDPTATWISNYWVNNGGFLYLIDVSGTDVGAVTRRAVTANDPLAAGSSAGITWDTGDPLDFSSYTRFMLVGGADPLAYVDRLFWITDPWSGNTGLNTGIGLNLRTRDPNGIPWANESQDGVTFYPAAKVLWGFNADNADPTKRWPITELPVGVRVIRQTGQILLDDPACLVAALAAGTQAALYNGYPASALNGLWYDLRVAVPFTRGPLVAQYPSSGFSGSAYTTYGIQRTKQVFLDSYTSRTQNANMIALATANALTVQDAFLEGTILYHGLPTGFDAFVPGQALQMIMPATSPLDSIPIPIRTTVIRWPADAVDVYNVSFRFSNRKAAFAGDSRYIHPNFTKDASNTYFERNGHTIGGAAEFNPVGGAQQAWLDKRASRREAQGGAEAQQRGAMTPQEALMAKSRGPAPITKRQPQPPPAPRPPRPAPVPHVHQPNPGKMPNMGPRQDAPSPETPLPENRDPFDFGDPKKQPRPGGLADTRGTRDDLPGGASGGSP